MKGAHIITRMSIFRRVTLYIPLTIFLLSLVGFAKAQGEDTATEISGEASVIIYDDCATGRFETLYYIIDREKGRETRVLFNKAAPKEFATGKKVKVRGRSRKNGLEVQNLTEMEGGTGAGQDQRSTAPVASAEAGRATACSDPVIV
ncbi:MAG: hypothetical protein QNK22_00595 [Xanthomonadales bacterium]|nr:hypothetical protein [Xanthomonadales bacterium]